MSANRSITIVVCEDDSEIRALLVDLLRREGYGALAAADGVELAVVLSRCEADLVILDWMLPGEDGLSICRRLRGPGGPPILMLTARDDDADRIVGLETGADVYVSKPFDNAVLLAQIRAMLRRSGAGRTTPRRLRMADLVLDVDARRVFTRDGDIGLTEGDFELLLCFAARPQRVLSREALIATTRGRQPGSFDRTIDVHVSRLRNKLEAAGSGVGAQIRAVRNAGYILAVPVEAD